MSPARYPGAALVSWLRIASSHGGVSASKLHHALPWILKYVLLEPSRLYESLRYDRRIKSHDLAADPIFVLGHWRSGTSHLQELLALDERHATPSLFQCLFPECALSGRWWLPGLMDGLASTFGIRYPIQDRPLRADLPAEEEIAMLCLADPASSNWGQLFPTTMRRHAVDASADDAKAAEWLRSYRFIVNKLSIAAPGRRLVLKSPMNTARLPLLSAAYPDAVFVHIHRHPLDVFASTRRLWRMILGQSTLQTLALDEIDALILDVFEMVMRRFLDARRHFDPARLVEVGYERLRSDPDGTLSEIYATLALGPPPADAVRRFNLQTPAPPQRPRELDADLAQRIRQRWSFAFEAWNYDQSATRAPAQAPSPRARSRTEPDRSRGRP